MRCLTGFIDELLEERNSVLAQVQLLNGAAAHFDQLHSQAVAAVDGPADEPLPFQHHKEPVNRALVQTQPQSQLCGAELLGGAGQRIQDPERAFENLYAVTSRNHAWGILSGCPFGRL